MIRMLYKATNTILALAAIVLTLASGRALAQTPDGEIPAQAEDCSGLSGAVFGLCTAYCEAQDCDVHPRPSCAQLRVLFQQLTGSSTFPCDPRCGNGAIEQGEECDPPGSGCAAGDICNQACVCERVPSCPVCGDGVVAPREQCDDGGESVLCDDDCTFRVCGDRNINETAGEQCDEGGESVLCDDDCTRPVCGDGNVNEHAGEQCELDSDCGSGFQCVGCTCELI